MGETAAAKGAAPPIPPRLAVAQLAAGCHRRELIGGEAWGLNRDDGRHGFRHGWRESAPRFDQGSGSAPGLSEASGRGEESWTSRTIPGDPVQSRKEARARVAAFVDWYNLQHRYSDIRFVTPSQRHSGDFVTIRRHQARVCSNNPAPQTGSPAPTFAQGRLRKIWIALVSCPIGGPDCWLGLDVVWRHGS